MLGLETVLNVKMENVECGGKKAFTSLSTANKYIMVKISAHLWRLPLNKSTIFASKM